MMESFCEFMGHRDILLVLHTIITAKMCTNILWCLGEQVGLFELRLLQKIQSHMCFRVKCTDKTMFIFSFTYVEGICFLWSLQTIKTLLKFKELYSFRVVELQSWIVEELITWTYYNDAWSLCDRD